MKIGIGLGLTLPRKTPAFVPSQISGLAAWYSATDAATITKDGSGLVSQWNDKSGNGNHLSQDTALRQPKISANAINGLPAIQGRHDGTNATWLLKADNASLDWSTMAAFIVGQRVSDLNTIEWMLGKFDGFTPRQEWIAYINSDKCGGQTYDGSSNYIALATPAISPTTGTPFLAELQHDGTTLTARRDGGGDVTAGPVAAVVNSTAGITAFARTDNAQPFAGFIGEMLLFSVNPSSADKALLRTYLKSKWGIA
ncbi:MAG: hypothetical protein AB7F35_00610 [Acetobacteraceae bacterium]